MTRIQNSQSQLVGLAFAISLVCCQSALAQAGLSQSEQAKAIEAAKQHEQRAQEIASLPRLYVEASYESAWLDGMSEEAERSDASFRKAMTQVLKPGTIFSTKTMAWDEKKFLFGYDKPSLDGANGKTRIVNQYFSHDDSIWQRQQTNNDAPQYVNLELPTVWKRTDARAFFHLRSASLEFPWGKSDGNIKFALVPADSAEYQVVGQEAIDDSECWVVLSKPRRCKLWFDKDSGRLLQMLNYVMEGIEPTPFHETAEVEKLCGKKFETLKAFRDFAKNTDQATRQRLTGLFGLLYFDDLAHGVELTRFSDYREIASGAWFPYKAIDIFAGHLPTDRNKFRFSRGELRVTKLETDRSLQEQIAALVADKR